MKELSFYGECDLHKSNPTNVMNLNYNSNIQDEPQIKEIILDYVNSHTIFTLNDIVYWLPTKLEPFIIRDIAHKVLNPMVANKTLIVKWDQGYYYERSK